MPLRVHLENCFDKICGFYYNYRYSPKPLPKPSNSLVLESASNLVKKIKTGELKSEEVVRAFIAQIQQVNPLINAVVDERFEDAIQEAREIDNLLASGHIPDDKPLLGIPFTVKESISAKGLANTFGLVSRKNHIAEFDAICVERVKKAGAINLGVTNIPQLSAWYESYNPVYGTTCNPYDLNRTVGGSSGGEACNVAACGAAFGIGSDLAGSIRHPAFMCGVFGHKCTGGLTNLHGVMFNLDEKKNSMACIGPLTRYSEDLIPILKAVLGDNVNQLKLDEEVDLRSMRVFYVLDPKDSYVSPIRGEMKDKMLQVVDFFDGILPEKPQLLEIEELKNAGKFWRFLISQEANIDFERDLTNRESRVSRVKESFKYLLGSREFTIGVILALIVQNIKLPEEDWSLKMFLLRQKLIDILGTNGVLLYPSAPYAARYHYTNPLRPFNQHLFQIWNALKFCVTQVPLGLNSEGLPIGIQVVGAPFQDHLTIAVARELEKQFGGYTPPFLTEK